MFLVRYLEAGRDAQRGGQRRDLASVLTAHLPGARIEIEPGRLVVEVEPSAVDAAHAVLAELSGITSYSPATRVPLDQLDGAVAARAAAIPRDGSFRMRVRRRGEVEPGGSSGELARRLGGVVLAARPDVHVDLHEPDWVIGVEVRDAIADVFDEVVVGRDWRCEILPGAPYRPSPPVGELRFVADQMLGRLATWLRLLGHDTVHPWDQPDSWVLRIARDEDRIILTRDGPLAKVRSTPVYFVEARRPIDQVAEVIRAFDLELDETRLFSRCPRCNRLVEAVDRDAVIDRLPPAVAQTQQQFRRCVPCDRIYWRGAHVERILRVLDGST